MKKLIYFFLFSFLLIGCKENEEADVASGEYYYTCSMHPQIMENHPGLCPICHMELIKVKRTQSAPGEIKLNEDQIRLGNIVVEKIGSAEMGNQWMLTGSLTTDETRTEGMAARITGRIDQLNFRNIGDFIRKGQPVFSIYSEELNNAKQELVALMEKKKTLDNSIVPFDDLIKTTEQKLQLLGMSSAQIETLERTGKSSDLTTYYSPVSGFLTELPVMQGDYVSEGGMVMRIADLSKLWLEVQVYVSQLSQLPEGSEVDIELPDLSKRKLRGRVSFISPELMGDSRLVQVRVEVSNPDGLLRPGMPAYIIAKPDKKNTLTLPSEAVIREPDKNIVWVRTAPDTFKWREVQLGNESNQQIAIVGGLSEGDEVVTNGAYLLHSEYLIKNGDVAGHQH